MPAWTCLQLCTHDQLPSLPHHSCCWCHPRQPGSSTCPDPQNPTLHAHTLSHPHPHVQTPIASRNSKSHTGAPVYIHIHLKEPTAECYNIAPSLHPSLRGNLKPGHMLLSLSHIRAWSQLHMSSGAPPSPHMDSLPSDTPSKGHYSCASPRMCTSRTDENSHIPIGALTIVFLHTVPPNIYILYR